MPSTDGSELLRDLETAPRPVKTLALGIPEIESAVLECARAGFSGYVPLEASIEDLILAIESVAKNGLYFSPRVSAYLFRRIGRSIIEHVGAAPELPLTEREIDVLRLVQQGLSNKMISEHLGIRVQTVKNHVRNILAELGVENRVAAAVFFALHMDNRNVLRRVGGVQ